MMVNTPGVRNTDNNMLDDQQPIATPPPHDNRAHAPKTDFNDPYFTVDFKIAKNIEGMDIGVRHYEVIKAMFTANKDMVIHTTNTGPTTPKKKTLRSIEDFPKDDAAHKEFFKRMDRDRETIISHKIYTSDTVKEFSDKHWHLLSKHNIFMTNKALDYVRLVVVGYELFGPHKMMNFKTTEKQFQKVLEERMQEGIITVEQKEAINKFYEESGGDRTKPIITIRFRKLRHGKDILTEVPTILVPRGIKNVMKEIVAMMAPRILSGDYLPVGIAQEIGSAEYKEMLMADHRFETDHLGSLVINDCHAELLDTVIPEADTSDENTIRKWIESRSYVVSLQPKNEPGSWIRYLVAIDKAKKSVSEARQEVDEFLQNLRATYNGNTHQESDNYDATEGHQKFPYIQTSAPSGSHVRKSISAIKSKYRSIVDATPSEMASQPHSMKQHTFEPPLFIVPGTSSPTKTTHRPPTPSNRSYASITKTGTTTEPPLDDTSAISRHTSESHHSNYSFQTQAYSILTDSISLMQSQMQVQLQNQIEFQEQQRDWQQQQATANQQFQIQQQANMQQFFASMHQMSTYATPSTSNKPTAREVSSTTKHPPKKKPKRPTQASTAAIPPQEEMDTDHDSLIGSMDSDDPG